MIIGNYFLLLINLELVPEDFVKRVVLEIILKLHFILVDIDKLFLVGHLGLLL